MGHVAVCSGIGEVKLLKHKETGKFRCLMRQEKTMKVILNHNLMHQTELVRARRGRGAAPFAAGALPPPPSHAHLRPLSAHPLAD